jgi:hypothetical protein
MSKTPEIRIKVPDVDRLLLLTEAQLKVWLWYKRREGKDKRAYGKAQTIANACGLEAGTVRNARSWLVRNGWLLRREEPGKPLPLFLAVISELHQGTLEVSSSNDRAVILELQGVSFESEAQVVSKEVASMKDSALTSGDLLTDRLTDVKDRESKNSILSSEEQKQTQPLTPEELQLASVIGAAAYKDVESLKAMGVDAVTLRRLLAMLDWNRIHETGKFMIRSAAQFRKALNAPEQTFLNNYDLNPAHSDS